MPRSLALLLSLATLSAAATAQSVPGSTYLQSQPAPIERAAPSNPYANEAARPQTISSWPASGVLLRVAPNSAVSTVSADANRVELRLDRGIANVNIHDPGANTIVLVDLPGGQTQLLENGLYTFNASTNTVRVLKGEADAFPGQATTAIKVKEDHQLTLAGSNIRSVDLDQAGADLLPGEHPHNSERRYREVPEYGFYGYGYPYYAYGNPYGFYGYGYPYGYGYGYPFGVGLGFGYFGGFHGGFRGGFHGGFHR